MDEYKQWVMNEMSQMPVSGWYRSTCVGGSLIITDEAFEKMKSDPEWGKYCHEYGKKDVFHKWYNGIENDWFSSHWCFAGRMLW